MSNHIKINNNNNGGSMDTKPKVSSYIPKAMLKWLDTGHKLGILSRKDEYKFVAKYMALRSNGGTVRKQSDTPDFVDDELDVIINTNQVYNLTEMWERIRRKYPQSTQSALYHRVQKLVDSGKLEKTNVGGKVLYSKKNTQTKDKQ